MINDERLRFIILFSAKKDKIPKASEYISQQLTKQFGGVTAIGTSQDSELTGYWAEDGHAFKKTYTGKIHKESVLGIMLTVLPEYEERAYHQIRHVIENAVAKFNLESQHIHVEVSLTRARHFVINERSENFTNKQ